MLDLPERLRRVPDLMVRAPGTYQFNIEGRDGTLAWHYQVSAQRIESHQGPAVRPDLTVDMTEADFLAFCEGRLSGKQAFLEERIRVAGNWLLALRVGRYLKEAFGS